ncbi:NADH-quinone oxidoreductase subunit B family protein [Gluconobacter morbifer]|uniref:NADH:ubiquinone oxidoreductase-like 20kDa subunit domain-containing protein n=1 Tax=Gluconobacter morbifer G707 TaxID=1088869 RepID=G6XLC3_9PROT|nr:hypothetical protein [Gluconobacter morbifer]EHH67178.1 hypothetical protein GMO_21710 [Gluconobacter morbifer G707]
MSDHRPGPVTLLQAFLDASRWRPSAEHSVRRDRLIGLYVLETGGCEGCFMEVEALCGSAFALERSGFRRVMDPVDADWLLVTGALTRNCVDMLNRVWREMPPGRSLVAVGGCAVDGGPFATNYAVLGGLRALTAVRRMIPGCPPSPQDILLGLQELAER